jgi:phosphoribosylformimino-5-aminoimidazole carboxamide ribotide isomerase
LTRPDPPLELYPAIDLRAGHCVRLYQGDFDRETVYGDDPVAQARAFAAEGARWIHVVDLDAARSGEPVNRPVVAAITSQVDVAVQTGGGVRDLDSARALAAAGVARVVVGTAAMSRPELVGEIAAVVPVAVGLDVRGREIAVRGWEEGSGADVAAVLPTFDQAGAAASVVTQIEVDGTGDGPDLAAYRELLAVTELPLIASGGVGTLDHLRALADLEVGGRRLAGAIVGRALYEGAFTLTQAMEAVS